MIAACRLDAGGLRLQRDRYRALGAHATTVSRKPQRLTVRFDAGVDLDLLRETVEVERGCCPFFGLAPDLERRELVVSVAAPEHDPALDAIADQLRRR
jgi:hypothetical protein